MSDTPKIQIVGSLAGGLTETNVRTIIAEEFPDMITGSEVRTMVFEATADKLNSDEVRTIVSEETADKITADEVRTIVATETADKLNSDEVRSIVSEETADKVTETEVRAIVSEETNGKFATEEYVDTAIGNIDIPPSGLDEEQVRTIVTEETANAITEDEVKEIVATETEGKFTPIYSDLLPSALGDGYAVLYNTDGKTVQRRMISGAYSGVGTIPYRGTNGVIYVGDATADNHATTLKQLKEYTAPIAENTKRIENLESTLLTYVEDTASAYEKSVPVGVAPNAILDMVGGASYASKNAFNPALLSGYSAYEITEDGGIRYLNDVTIEGMPPDAEIGVTLNAGTWYISASGEGNLPSSFEAYGKNGDYMGFPLTLEERQTIRLRWYYEIEGFWEKPFYIMLSQTEDAPYEPYFTGLRNAPVTEVIGKDTEGYELQTVEISEALRKACGENYGEAYTYIDFDNKRFVDEGYTFILDGTENFGYHKYVDNIGVAFYDVGKPWSGAIAPHISTEATNSWYRANGLWCGYSAGKTSYWLGILDILGYTSEWVDRLNPTAEEKAEALAKFKQYVTDRYNSGNPITVRQQVQGDDITYIDLSAYLADYTDFKTIKVQAGGTIVCENNHKYAVPSTLTYVKRKE